MSATYATRKLARSALVRAPAVYELLTAQWRYRMYHRLGVVHEREFRALPLLVERPEPLVLDVGGNSGQSILSIKTVLPKARVITFEPAARHAVRLLSLADRFDDVQIEACALSDVSGEAELFWPVYRGMTMDALASLDRTQVMSWLGPDGLYGFDRDRLSIVSETIRVCRLDDFGLEPDVLKLDVQGAESKVIAGAMETIRRCRPALMLEDLVEGDDSHRLLEPFGYDVYTYGSDGRFELGTTAPAMNRFLLPAERLTA